MTGGKLLLDLFPTPVPPLNPMYLIIGTTVSSLSSSGLGSLEKAFAFALAPQPQSLFRFYTRACTRISIVYYRYVCQSPRTRVRRVSLSLSLSVTRARITNRVGYSIHTKYETGHQDGFARGSVALSGACTRYYRLVIFLSLIIVSKSRVTRDYQRGRKKSRSRTRHSVSVFPRSRLAGNGRGDERDQQFSTTIPSALSRSDEQT